MNTTEITALLSVWLDFQNGQTEAIEQHPEWRNFPKTGMERVEAFAEWYCERHPDAGKTIEATERERLIAIRFTEFCTAYKFRNRIPKTAHWIDFIETDQFKTIPPAPVADQPSDAGGWIPVEKITGPERMVLACEPNTPTYIAEYMDGDFWDDKGDILYPTHYQNLPLPHDKTK